METSKKKKTKTNCLYVSNTEASKDLVIQQQECDAVATGLCAHAESKVQVQHY